MNLIYKQIQLSKYLRSQQNLVLRLLLTLSVVTLLFASQISGYLSNYDVNYWFDYFVITERFSMLLLLLSVSKYLKERCWLGYELLLAFLVQDFIDRVFLDVQVFNINDVICLGFIGIQLIYKMYKKYNEQI